MQGKKKNITHTQATIPPFSVDNRKLPYSFKHFLQIFVGIYIPGFLLR